MFHTTMLAAALAVGVDTGWKPAQDGGVEYIIQVDPQLIQTLGEGEMLQMDLPEKLQNVRRFQIVVGRQELPRIDPQPPPKTEPAPKRAAGGGETLGSSEKPLGDAGAAGAGTGRYGEPAASSAARGTDDSRGEPLFAGPRNKPNASEPSADTGNRYQPQPKLPSDLAAGPPRTFDLSSGAKPLAERVAAFKQPSAKQKEASQKEDAAKSSKNEDTQASPSDVAVAASTAAEDPARPWLPLFTTVILLSGSLAANVYLVLMWLETRRRYHTVVVERAAG